jgi:hypothetical protein
MMALEGGLLARPVAEITGSGAATVLTLRTAESINEPAFNVSVEIGCTSSVKREYQILLDPVPATVPMTASAIAPAAKPERGQRKTASQAANTTAPVAAEISPLAASTASALPTTKAPASAARKPAAPPRPKPAAETKSVLTLSGGDAEIEQVRVRLALRSATVLSEPRMEADPARLAALRADQLRVAALLRGEDPLAGTQAQLRDTQEKLLAAQKSAASAARLHEQEKAALTAAQDDMVSDKLLALLGTLLAACVAVIGWLLWRRADDRRRQEQAFFAMAVEPEVAPAVPSGQQQHAEPENRQGALPKAAAAAGTPTTSAPVASVPSQEAEAPMDFALPEEHVAPAPTTALPEQNYQWRAEATLPTMSSTVSSTPPEPLHLSDSWFTLESHAEDNTGQASQPGTPALALPSTDDNAQAHAAEVAGLLAAAESWMAEHNPLRAVEVLRPYLDRAEMQSPAPALYLLSLYRTMDDKGQMATVLAQLQQDFPVEAAAWGDPAQPRRSMADFPLVHAVVDSLSDSDKLLPYLDSLLLAPEHFDFSTYREIVRAIGLANEMKQESEMQSMSLDFR